MENHTSAIEFYLLPFSMKAGDEPVIFCIFFGIFLFGVMVNAVIIIVICLDSRLHTPMYLFLCNLSFVDVCYTTVTVPKLLDILLSGNHTVSYTQCFTQMYFFFIAALTEFTLLFVMSYDRYIAICHPLHYQQILSKKVCTLLVALIWLCACVNSMLCVFSVIKMSFCHSVTIHQFFCDAKALSDISCSGSSMFYIVTYINIVLFIGCPFLSNVMSYIKIIRVILHIKSKEGRRKTFSTCSSHLTVMIIFYANCMCVYLMPPSDHPIVLEQVFTVLYTTVVPMVNPLIYSLRNNEIKRALQRLVALPVSHSLSHT
ncbi:olfactory receptor 1M1-like [Pseudophryne corroboree]|uniref:olfactory receptor 1M1-like n=1 Tax=Pseudophryne corroboree TaxID=495146 RepID=UPI003081D193